MSFFLFTKTGDQPITKRKKIRNIIYRVCGIGMLVSFALLFIPADNVTWIVEAIALFFFGLSWIVKSDACPFLRDKE